MFKMMLGAVIFVLSITSNNLQNAYAETLIPGGDNILFEIKTDGVIVTGAYDIKVNDNIYNPIRHSDIEKGDLIKRINGEEVTDIKTFLNKFNKNIDKNEVNLLIERNGKLIYRSLKVIKVNDVYKTGLYVKERVMGIGTMSFIDPINHLYGALGHEVYDSDSDTILEVRTGTIYDEDVIKISKGNDGDPGEKYSTTTLDNPIGTIFSNTKFGIYGSISDIPSTTYSMEMATYDQVRLGKAEILTCIEGTDIEKFDIEITSLKKQETSQTKGISFVITDNRLLEKTGGVYAGMSGSPIIQNNKLVGAVTHVLIDDIDHGYGVYMQYMYEEGLKLLPIQENN